MNWLTKILKKEKEVGKKEVGEKEKKSPVPAALKEKEIERAVESGRARGKFTHNAFRAHHLTEKASLGKEQEKYVFKVFPEANKFMVKRAVEEHFGVQVKSVNMVNTRGKKIRRGKQIGYRPGLKKAIVTLKKGESIETT